jgi:hypothetical protein
VDGEDELRVMTSPFFMRPTAATPARKIDLGMRIGF